MVYGSTAAGMARRRGEWVEILDLPHRSLGEALAAGVGRGQLDQVPARQVLRLEEVTPLAPVSRPGNVWAVGGAYQSHLDELPDGVATRSAVPPVFLKASSSVIGPGQPIELPAIAPDAVDYEGEVALVIGARGREIPAEDGWRHVFGVTAANDVSARDVQGGRFMSGMVDFKSKSFDTFTPLGPWVATADEYADPDDVWLRTLVNGECRQSASTHELLYPVPLLVSFVSRFATLEPGDVILTGTPGGVGFPRARYLRQGDEVRVEVEVAGALVNPVVKRDQGGK